MLWILGRSGVLKEVCF